MSESSPSPKFLNRELSWLEFNQRVLDEATDESLPLLERLKFLAITSSNLDEFFMVRVGGLQMLRERRGAKRDPAGMTPSQQLKAVSQRAHQMVADQYRCLLDQLEPGLAGAGIQRVAPEQLTEHQESVVQKVFDSEVFPVYTPMAVHAEDEFPLLINKSLNICVRLAPAEGSESPRFAILPFGAAPVRFFRLPADEGYRYILLEDLVSLFIGQFFSGETVLEAVPFRLTRNADMSVREDQAADLLTGMEEVLDARKESSCVRLEVAQSCSSPTLAFLKSALGVGADYVFPARGPLDLSAWMSLGGIPGFDDLKYEPWPPRKSPDVDPTDSMFDAIRQKGILLSLPYESFEPVVRLIEQAADDPGVLAIKIILYRTSRNSPIVAALQRASESGKHVTALVELKARFDEARNIGWAKSLEQAGVQVIYGVKGLKTHAKVCIIMRREAHGIQRYVHFATGNYNEVTAKLYCDVGFLTCDEELAADATSFFNAITGYSVPQQYRKIAAAPFSLRDKLLDLIDGEIDRRKRGQRAHIMAQVNSLSDPKLIQALYRASKAGVRVDLNIRGICCLRPGVPELSEHIRVVSILDRYLEHARIIYFYHGGAELVYISSADWMLRNLEKRVELLVPIEDAPSRQRLIAVLKSYTRDNVKGRKLLADGTYQRRRPGKEGRKHRHQEHLYRLAREAEKMLEQSQRTVFRPHRAAGKEE
jgi:polyphosphate kinase